MHFVLPVLLLTAFKAISFNELSCPSYHKVLIDEQSFDMIHHYNSYEYDIQDGDLNPYEIKGKDCYVASFQTGCKFHYFAANDIMQKIERKTTSIENCEQPSVDVIKFPEEECVGGLFDNSYHYVSEEHIISRQKSYIYDPELNNLANYDKIFSHKEGMIYEYKDKKGYWIRDNQQRLHTCSTFEEISYSDLTIKIWKSKTSSTILADVNGKVYDLDNICYHDHCGVTLAVTKDHVYFKLPGPLNVKKCNHSNNELYSNTEISEIKEELKECLEEKVNLMSKNEINYKSLMKFIPSTGGIYPVYKLNGNNTLMKALARYSEVKKEELDKYASWEKCGKKTKCSYNGIIQANLTEIYGKLFNQEDLRIHLDEVEIGIIAYPRDIKITQGHSEDIIYTKSMNTIMKLLIKLSPWAAEAILILIVIYILWCKLCKNKKRKPRIALLSRGEDGIVNW